MKAALRKYFGRQQRMWAVGPICLLVFWMYSIAVPRTGVLRYIIGGPFMAVNAVFNIVFGTFMFWDRPKEWFFTDRLTRYKRGSDTERRELARILCRELNKIDPGHC